MNLKTKIRKVLRESYGDFNTLLEHEYENKLIDILIVGDLDNKRAWATYNQLMLELKNSIKDTLKVKELQYKLTENLDPNEVCIQIIETLQFRTPELERLYNKIRNF
jgi:hypothetical protein